MLAQNFKTPADLRLPTVEFDALISVLSMLEREEIPDCKFDMSSMNPRCNTAFCICGWAFAITDGRAFPEIPNPNLLLSSRLPKEARDLFRLDTATRFLEGITRTQAATALRSYLTTGEANWKEAMAA